MEVVQYNKVKGWNILGVRDKDTDPVQGYIVRFIGESGIETRVACKPEELKELGNGCFEAIKQFGEEKP